MKETLEKFSVNDYVAVLPATSRSSVLSLIEAGADPSELALLLSVEPGEGLATKGGEAWPKDILARVRREMHAFICTDDARYTELRGRLEGEVATSANVVVYLVSTAVATQAGMAAALCVPLVALLLASAVKIGVAAWCQTDPLQKTG